MILDTNVISEIMRPVPDPRVVAWFGETAGEQRYVTAITEAELLFGIALMPAGKRRDDSAAAIARVLGVEMGSPALPFESGDAPFFAGVMSTRQRAGRPVSVVDAQIAAIALRRGLPVVTRNTRDFEGCGVTLINPWKSQP
ncbi:type II toxin-antitoxin system VapC family toxin [Hoeflea olei]|uniref:Ribonuclease VapC n=1 Tax=Hoeflea olei TaxID=1480615 RepID=A0A1C1YVP5_9HYPH|nr:type II toxin-antitoxin system VapC family toxin [Hoeflea olei]OCW57529.1 plasmid stabilization protein [Hoeflea olei]